MALRLLGIRWLKAQLDLGGVALRPKRESKRGPESSLEANAKQPIKKQPLDLGLPKVLPKAQYEALHEAVRLAARAHPMRPACLPKSIVLVAMMRNNGYQAKVVLGVAKDNDRLASHAWVEARIDDVWQMIGEPEAVSVDFSRI